MSQSISPFGTTQGYAPPTVTQFSVFLDNKVGKLRELLQAFENSGTVRIWAMNVHDASDHAVVRLVTNLADEALDVLTSAGFSFSETEVLLVELDQSPSLHSLCQVLLGAELNILFGYPMLAIEGRGPVLVLAVDDPTLAAQILRKKLFTLLAEGDLPGP